MSGARKRTGQAEGYALSRAALQHLCGHLHTVALIRVVFPPAAHQAEALAVPYPPLIDQLHPADHHLQHSRPFARSSTSSMSLLRTRSSRWADLIGADTQPRQVPRRWHDGISGAPMAPMSSTNRGKWTAQGRGTIADFLLKHSGMPLAPHLARDR